MADLPPPPPGFKLVEHGEQLPPPPAGFTISQTGGAPDQAPSAAPPQSGAFFGAAKLLPESVQQYLPGFLKGPSIGEQLTASGEKIDAEEKRLGRRLTVKERLAVEPVTENPVAMGFATHQIGELPGAMPSATKAASEKFIADQYTRAVKPTVAGKQTATQRHDYQEHARDAVSSIVANKQNLMFRDVGGTVRQGELPRSLEEFSDAVEQTKQSIFSEYDALAKQTQSAGVDVTLMSAEAELRKLASDQVTQLMHPELATYAESRADAFAQRGQLSATDAQRAVTSLNANLKSYYNNIATPGVAARAHVDAMIANKLRESLDEAVTNVSGPGYQELKNQYGSLRAIEKDVNHRAQVVARQEPGGGILGRLADVASAEEVIRGFLTLNPIAVASATSLKGWAEWMKFRRNPNRAVTRLFEEAEGQSAAPKPPIVPSFPVPLGISAADQSNSVGLMGAAR